MGFLKMITLVCDGPCGTTLRVSKMPPDWASVNLRKHERLEPGQKPQYKGDMVLCPKCHANLENAIHAMHYSINFGAPRA